MSVLTRKRYLMPDDIKQALEQYSVMDDYLARPDYQQNDYIGWVTRAKRQETRDKRIQQMLDELTQGGVYMKMKHAASIK